MLFIKTVVRECRIPFEIKTESVEESRKKALLIPAKSITFGRFRSAAYATAMALGI